MLDRFKTELLKEEISWVASKWILDRPPEIFCDDVHEYIYWKELLSAKIGVDSRAISFTGSSCTGFSLNPSKDFRYFNDSSDIDVAIISQYYFDISWHFLRNLGSERHSFTPTQKFSIKEHVNRLIYWGTIATDKIISILPFGSVWVRALDEMAKVTPTEGREINVRIYKDFESLRAYHINNLKNLKDDLTETELGVTADAIILENNP